MKSFNPFTSNVEVKITLLILHATLEILRDGEYTELRELLKSLGSFAHRI